MCEHISPRRRIECVNACDIMITTETLIEINSYYTRCIMSPFRPTLITTTNPSGDVMLIPAPSTATRERAAADLERYHLWSQQHLRPLTPRPEFHDPLDQVDLVYL